MALTLTALHRYPVKSCRGEAVTHAAVEPWGLAADRRWMLVDDAGAAITAREVNAMLLLRPEITEAGLRLHAAGSAGRAPLDVPLPDPAVQVPISLWGSHLTAAPTGRDAAAWVSDVLGVSARLVWLDDPARRPTDPAFTSAEDRVSLADGYPLLLASEESLAALNDQVLASGGPAAAALPMTRFRPNVVVRGAAAWTEDDWRRIRIGEATFRAVKGCARCVLTTIDPDTAERGKEPIASLARLRRWDNKTWFGINLQPDGDGTPAGRPRISVGDEVEVLDAVAPGGGPLR
ncbi:MOSC domain-containing protein [soil metagenome]